MLASHRCTDCSIHGFLPTTPSPLSPRSTNIYGRRPPWMASSPEVAREEQKCAKTVFTVPRPTVKKAPSPKQDELKERRRSMFLRKVREGREDRRFEARGEDIMRLDFMQRQRQWEAEQAREAPSLSSDPIEEEEEEGSELPSSSGNTVQMSAPPSQQPLPDEEVDEVVQRESEELEALLSYMSTEATEDEIHNERLADHPWSDDDNYDTLFSEFVDENGDTEPYDPEAEAPHPHDPQFCYDDDEAMDLS